MSDEEIIDVDPIEDEKDEVTGAEIEAAPIGQVSIYRSMDPAEQLAEAQARAAVLVQVVKDQGLAKRFGSSPKPHVFVEGWQFLASQFGLVPDIEWSRELDGGDGWEARAALTRLSDGQVIAHADAECRTSEGNWKGRPSYAVRSMAQTRAVSKVCRIALSSVMVMAGFNATPAEEMTGIYKSGADPDGEASGSGYARVQAPTSQPATAEDPHCPACLEVNGELVAVTGPHDRKPYWRCTNNPLDCGGHRTYNGKDYSWSGWHKSFENSVADWKGGVISDAPKTSKIDPQERTNRSDYIIEEIQKTGGLDNVSDAKILVKPGLVLALSEGNINATAALGGRLGDPDDPTDDELRTIVTLLTLPEADHVIAAAASLVPKGK